MSFADQLRAMKACHEAVAWVGNRTLAQAWNECERDDWMAWLLYNLRFDFRACVADIAESVWHLVEPDSQLACAWAIDCARRGADEDEMAAAGAAAWAAGAVAWAAAGAVAWAVAWAAAGSAAGAAAGAKQRALNCAIIREHFTAAMIAERMREQEPRT